MFGFTIFSLSLFALFIVLSIYFFGLQSSYSAYASKWDEKLPMETDTHLWSIITILTAITLIPPMLQLGTANIWQCLGFFAPGYLVVVGFTPRYETDFNQRRIHVLGAFLCAAVSWLWLIFVALKWYLPLISVIIAIIIAVITRTIRKSYVFWGEMAMFASVYSALLI